mgnify:CR=1 FL=1
MKENAMVGKIKQTPYFNLNHIFQNLYISVNKQLSELKQKGKCVCVEIQTGCCNGYYFGNSKDDKGYSHRRLYTCL